MKAYKIIVKKSMNAFARNINFFIGVALLVNGISVTLLELPTTRACLPLYPLACYRQFFIKIPAISKILPNSKI